MGSQAPSLDLSFPPPSHPHHLPRAMPLCVRMCMSVGSVTLLFLQVCIWHQGFFSLTLAHPALASVQDMTGFRNQLHETLTFPDCRFAERCSAHVLRNTVTAQNSVQRFMMALFIRGRCSLKGCLKLLPVSRCTRVIGFAQYVGTGPRLREGKVGAGRRDLVQ